MSHLQHPQHPQQPGWGGPQQPYGQPPFQPQPPRKSGVGKVLGFGCLGLVGVVVLFGVAGALLGGGSGSKGSSGSGDVEPTVSTPKKDRPAAANNAEDDDEKAKKQIVTFKVWGTAPAGALGPLDITYGSDSDNREGTFANGEFEATLPLDKGAMYYNVTAQLQGSGDIHCSVTVDGDTKKGHASGGYNLCSAQLSSGLLGGWD